jgi:hypothetical protein
VNAGHGVLLVLDIGSVTGAADRLAVFKEGRVPRSWSYRRRRR